MFWLRSCQDLLEEYFGRQRERGRFNDNPTLQAFGYNDLTLAVQRNIAPVVKGNVAGDTREGAQSGMLCLTNHCQSKRNKKNNKSTACYPTTTIIQITHIQPGTDGLNIFIVSTSINALALYVCSNFISPCFISKINLIKMLS